MKNSTKVSDTVASGSLSFLQVIFVVAQCLPLH